MSYNKGEFLSALRSLLVGSHIVKKGAFDSQKSWDAGSFYRLATRSRVTERGYIQLLIFSIAFSFFLPGITSFPFITLSVVWPIFKALWELMVTPFRCCWAAIDAFHYQNNPTLYVCSTVVKLRNFYLSTIPPNPTFNSMSPPLHILRKEKAYLCNYAWIFSENSRTLTLIPFWVYLVIAGLSSFWPLRDTLHNVKNRSVWRKYGG